MGRSLLDYQIERLKRTNNADDIVIATTTNQSDDPVEELCRKLNCYYYRGSEDNVLLRYYEAAKEFQAECVVRINADCPLIDPNVVDKIINHFLSNNTKFDYVSNILESSYPIGLHTEAFSLASLEKVNNNAKDPIDREHVTPYIYKNPDIFKIGSITHNTDLSHYRWTVDYPEDFDLVKKIIEGIYPVNADFDMHDILAYLGAHPELNDINSGITKEQTIV